MVGLHLSVEKGKFRWFPETKSVTASGATRKSGMPDRSLTSLQDFFSFQNPSICKGILSGIFSKCAAQSCNERLFVNSVWLCSISCIQIAGYPEKLFMLQFHDWMQQSKTGFDKGVAVNDVQNLIRGTILPFFQCDLSTYIDHTRTLRCGPQ